MVIRRQHAGGAPATTLASGIGAADASFSVAAGTGTSYPDGSVGPFFVTIDGNTASEERVLVTSRIGDTFSGVSRGQDGTSAATHSAGAAVAHTFSALEADEANSHVMATAGAHAATAISITALTHSVATTVQGALADLDGRTRTVPHTWTVSGTLAVASGDTDYINGFFVPVPAGQAVSIRSARYRINSGTSATVKVQKNGVDVTGLTALSVTTTATTTTQAATLANNDLLTLVVTAVSGTPKNLSFTLYLDYVAA